MRKVFLIIIGICILNSFVLCTGCTPEQIQKFQDKTQYQLTDPTSQTQQIAGTVGQAADTAQAVLAPVAAAIPYGAIILAVLGVISGACNVIQKMQSTKQVQAIKEIVAGGEAFKAASIDTTVTAFKQAQAAAQSATTKVIVTQAKT